MKSPVENELVALAAKVIDANRAAGRTIAVAESCTGGLVSAALTEISGSSAVFDRGFITYSNEAKRELLHVPEEIIDAFGAVSVATVWAMAQGALKASKADVTVAISGIAGPDGGSAHRPVGTVVFARAIRGDDEIHAEERRLPGTTRGEIRLQAAVIALELLLP